MPRTTALLPETDHGSDISPRVNQAAARQPSARNPQATCHGCSRVGARAQSLHWRSRFERDSSSVPAVRPGMWALPGVERRTAACLLYTSDAADDLLCVD